MADYVSFYVIFKYEQIQWDMGNASGGIAALVGINPGWNPTGDSIQQGGRWSEYVLPGSLTAGAFLDTGSYSLKYKSNLLIEAYEGEKDEPADEEPDGDEIVGYYIFEVIDSGDPNLDGSINAFNEPKEWSPIFIPDIWPVNSPIPTGGSLNNLSLGPSDDDAWLGTVTTPYTLSLGYQGQDSNTWRISTNGNAFLQNDNFMNQTWLSPSSVGKYWKYVPYLNGELPRISVFWADVITYNGSGLIQYGLVNDNLFVRWPSVRYYNDDTTTKRNTFSMYILPNENFAGYEGGAYWD